MQFSRYLEVREFCDEAKKLHVVGYTDESVLERLENQRSLIPRLRLHYPDEIERRWWAKSHEGYEVGGDREPDGARWEDACALEELRRGPRWHVDPAEMPHSLDNPEPRFLQFIEKPAELPFVSWADYRVPLNVPGGSPLYAHNTVVTYYSTWQVLQFAEVANMGMTSFMNLWNRQDWPTAEDIAAPKAMSALPIHAMRGFEKHAPALDAIIWFAEEAGLGFLFATRHDHGRRLLSAEEQQEVMRTRHWAAAEAQSRHSLEPSKLLEAVRFLCGQWVHWEREGRPVIAGAYKSVVAQAVGLGCLVTGKTVERYRDEVGHVGGYFKPILSVIWPDWAADQRDDARRILVGYRRADALLRADFSDELVDRFLDFIDSNGLHGFYWRMESFHRHAFEGNEFALEGLKGDVQGMGVVLEHIVGALGSTRQQLSGKFKELWVSKPSVLKLLKNNAAMKVGQGKTIDLDWFETRNNLSRPEQIAADLAICYAIRGGAHRILEETNPLKLERMLLIMLRAAVRTFEVATRPAKPAHPTASNPLPSRSSSASSVAVSPPIPTRK